ncbi:WxcM-like domain-containing protein [Flavobacterium sp. CYK-4]|uniref:sugar 3,4-ketoisomerase n=1 Tax=Flavobacterium lotistagni TaxID=2709660 RepID=UPI00140A3A38|nr:FdtA/QdtA family cupin domain-containing protein [Flavobacterium lotistagni]NHM06462.1 WxcM-like domain-containing protein [Flavobacterium lotistagni]
MKTTTVFDCTMVELPINHQANGNLTAVSNSNQVPFDIKRVYYLYDVPGGFSRGGHGHLELQQLIVALSGSFDIIVDDGQVKRTFHLSRPNMGLYMPSGLWRELDNFSSGSICFVLASIEYDEKDYFRNYDQFKAWKSSK